MNNLKTFFLISLIFMNPDLFLSFQLWYQNFTYFSHNNAIGVSLWYNIITNL